VAGLYVNRLMRMAREVRSQWLRYARSLGVPVREMPSEVRQMIRFFVEAARHFNQIKVNARKAGAASATARIISRQHHEEHQRFLEELWKRFGRYGRLPRELAGLARRLGVPIRLETPALLRQLGFRGFARPVPAAVPSVAQARPWTETLGQIFSRLRAIRVEVQNLIGILPRLIGRFAYFIGLPWRVLGQIHMGFRRILFSVLLFWYSAERFIKPAVETIRVLQTAVILAGKSFDAWGQELRVVIDLASKYPVAIRDIAKGYLQVVKAGYELADAQKVLRSGLALSAITGEDLSRSLTVLITTLNAYEMSAQDSAEVARLLALTIRSSVFDIQSLQMALGYAASAGAALNLPLRDVLATLMYFKQAGLTASRAGVAFRTGVLRLSRALSAAILPQMNVGKAMRRLGIDVQNLAERWERGHLRMIDIIREFNRALGSTISTEERRLVLLIFGIRSGAYWLRLFQQGPAALNRYLQALEKQIDLERRAREITADLTGAFVTLQNAWLTFRLGVAEGLAPVLRQFARQFAEFLPEIQRWGREVGRLIGKALSQIAAPENFERIRRFLSATFEFLRGFIKGLLPELLRIGEAFGVSADEIFDRAKELGERIGGLVGRFFRFLMRLSLEFINALPGLIETIEAALRPLFSFIIQNVRTVFGMILGYYVVQTAMGLSRIILQIIIAIRLLKTMAALQAVASAASAAGTAGRTAAIAGGAAVGARAAVGAAARAGAGVAAAILPAAIAAAIVGGLLYLAYRTPLTREEEGERTEVETAAARWQREAEEARRQREARTTRADLTSLERVLEEQGEEAGGEIADKVAGLLRHYDERLKEAFGDRLERVKIELENDAWRRMPR